MGNVTVTKNKKEVKIKDFISWFEIPVFNFQQALGFYNHIYGINMKQQSANGYMMAFFPSDSAIGGAIVCGPGSIPSDTGTLIYLNGGKDLNNVLEKVEVAGGRIVMNKTFISDDAGYFAIFIDTEGNKLALHSKK
jgi:uncharacterized protein